MLVRCRRAAAHPVTEVPDYELPDIVVADQPHQLKALGDRARMAILDLVLERAASVMELAAALGKPKSTVAHHVQVLQRAGLLRVVRTRKVRAITEAVHTAGPDAPSAGRRPGPGIPCGPCWTSPWPEQLAGRDPVGGGGFTIRHASHPGQPGRRLRGPSCSRWRWSSPACPVRATSSTA